VRPMRGNGVAIKRGKSEANERLLRRGNEATVKLIAEQQQIMRKDAIKITVGELEMKKGTAIAFKSSERYRTYKRIDKGILRKLTRVASEHRLNMKLNLQSLFGLLCTLYSCTHWLRPATNPLPPHLGSYTRALLVSQDRRHLFATPCK
jgi:hypothetical protein